MDSQQFMPHGMCLLWKPQLLAAYVVADALIAIAYFTIPVILVWIVKKRGDIPYSAVFWMFAVFILSCGTTHVLDIIVIWHPVYYAEAVVKWITAIASIGTTVMLIPLIPKIMRIRSIAQSDELQSQLKREHSIASTFQNASLPQVPESVPGLAIHAIYRPAVRGMEIGGDWYDAFRLVDGRLLVSIGDVAGKGLHASVVMSKIRQAIRVAAHIQIDPASILDAADRALRAEYPDVFATAFVGLFDRGEGELSYASAGHPGPIIRYKDGHVEALNGSSLPLGLRLREESALSFTRKLDTDSLLVFFTDGLTEANRDLEGDEERLLAILAAPEIDMAVDPAAYVHDLLIVNEQRDDIAILTVRVTPLGTTPDTQEWTFDSADGVAAGNVRRSVRSFLELRGIGVGSLLNAELVYAELIGNVVRYAPGTAKVRMEWNCGRAVMHIFDDGAGFQHAPRLPRDIYAESGRGLFLIATLTEDFHISRRYGKGSHACAVLSTAESMVLHTA